MEADTADIAFADGAFTIAGTDRSMSIGQVAQMSFIPVGLPAALGVGLQGAGAFSSDMPSFPNGCHICEVEIDHETGEAALDRYTVVDDIGIVINPLLATGQIQGGVAQGAGQALIEDIVYDRDSGQLLTGTLMDYGIPRADTIPAISVDFSPVPSTTNLLGVKGVGEGGTVASTPTVMNAILDALAPLGVTDLAMPATPERVWRAIRARRTNAASASASLAPVSQMPLAASSALPIRAMHRAQDRAQIRTRLGCTPPSAAPADRPCVRRSRRVRARATAGSASSARPLGSRVQVRRTAGGDGRKAGRGSPSSTGPPTS